MYLADMLRLFLFATLMSIVNFGGSESKTLQHSARSNDSDYLNKEYSPSMWSKRYLNGMDVVGIHISFVTEESERVRQLFNYETISYGNSANETYDIYGNDLPLDAPVFVYIHGGYWQMLDKNVSAYCVEPLLSAGIKVIVLEYDLCPTLTLTELVAQVTKFGKFVLDNPDYAESKQIIFGGHSAGAHLILCMIEKLLSITPGHLRIDAIHLISGIYDLSEVQYTNNNENNILSIDGANVDQLSPLKFDFIEWPKHHIAINIYVGQYDSPTFIRQSMELYLRFSAEFGVDFQLLSEYDHFEIVEHLSRETHAITKRIIGGSTNSAHTVIESLNAMSLLLLSTVAFVFH